MIPHRKLFSTRAICAVAGITLTVAAYAGDARGNFAIKGVGVNSCARFAAAYERSDESMITFAGWLEGYLTVQNEHVPETFDLAPWQDIQVLTFALARYCKGAPEQSFHAAVRKLTELLRTQRLKVSSEMVVARSGGKGVLIYQSVLDDLRASLRAQGLLTSNPTGKFDEATASAIRAFQSRHQLTPTGIPDSATLIALTAKRVRQR
ncbi:MAG: peptidoglycan-binding protein [Pseudomonadota bacterium]